MNDQTPSPTDETRALLAAATPGPWYYNHRYGHVWATIDGSQITEWPVPDNARLIAASPRLLAALADRVELLEAAIRQHRETTGKPYTDRTIQYPSDARLWAVLDTAKETS